jgi:hypothetical protein
VEQSAGGRILQDTHGRQDTGGAERQPDIGSSALKCGRVSVGALTQRLIAGDYQAGVPDPLFSSEAGPMRFCYERPFLEK